MALIKWLLPLSSSTSRLNFVKHCRLIALCLEKIFAMEQVSVGSPENGEKYFQYAVVVGFRLLCWWQSSMADHSIFLFISSFGNKAKLIFQLDVITIITIGDLWFSNNSIMWGKFCKAHISKWLCPICCCISSCLSSINAGHQSDCYVAVGYTGRVCQFFHWFLGLQISVLGRWAVDGSFEAIKQQSHFLVRGHFRRAYEIMYSAH